MEIHRNYDTAAQKIIERVGKKIVIGIPLGIGKPLGLVNALYKLACHDTSISLTILTGLTLARPALKNEIQKRFVEPILTRLLKDYEDPLYEQARVKQTLPKNIRVIEFFLSPGKYLQNDYVQQNYISCTYLNAIRDIFHYSINVLAQQVARSPTNSQEFSLSSNSDLFFAASYALELAKKAGRSVAIVGEVNDNLPFMPGDAVVHADSATDIIDTGHYKALFAIPHEELSVQDHLIGLYTSCLIKDNGCLQIGIGKLGNALASALIFRHKNNAAYRELIRDLQIEEKFSETMQSTGEFNPFEKGIYASTEMFSDEYVHLYHHDILKKRVYDHIGLQRLLNEGKICEEITPELIDILLAEKIISSNLTKDDIRFLKLFGIINQEFELKIETDLSQLSIKEKFVKQHLEIGKKLKNGKLLHAAFFLGTNDFYDALRNFPENIRQQIEMTAIARTNSLLLDPELYRLQRERARFVNSAMLITLGGSIVSDGLYHFKEVSGVGGQFDFVSMAQELSDARLIMNCRSTRPSKKGLQSNIVWQYSNETIPRYLRDIVITEYGIADCRSKTDADVIKNLLNITDARFQNKLLALAKKHKKIPADYQIPQLFRLNSLEKLQPIIEKWKAKGYFLAYPFGTELTEEEQKIKHFLLRLKNANSFELFKIFLKSLFVFRFSDMTNQLLLRLGLNHPKNLKEKLYRRLIIVMSE